MGAPPHVSGIRAFLDFDAVECLVFVPLSSADNVTFSVVSAPFFGPLSGVQHRIFCSRGSRVIVLLSALFFGSGECGDEDTELSAAVSSD